MQLNTTTLNKWIPHKLVDTGDEMYCEWLFTANEEFRDAFFENILKRFRKLPQNTGPQKNFTTVGQLIDWAANIQVQQPAAIIFHISRCGSTIVSQAFANNINNIVLSEVPFFDDILRMPYNSHVQPGALLKETVKLYSLPRNGHGNCVFIKTDSWHIMFYKQLRQLYPGVPFIMLYRNPAEVVASLNRQLGMHCIPQLIAPEFLGITGEIATAEDFYNYPIKVIEKYLEAYINIIESDNNALLFNYNSGMLQVMEDIFAATGTPFTGDDRQQMQEQLKFHSKTGTIYFSPQPGVQSSGERFLHLFNLYNRLEEWRLGRK
jgi:hypothetical protein